MMITEKMIWKKIGYKQIVEFLEEIMAANFEDFTAEQEACRKAISALAAERQGDSPSAEDVTEAIFRQVGCGLLFTFHLGLKANFDHFAAPTGATFLDYDPEVYLQEETAKQLPDYRQTQLVKSRLYASLSPGQEALYEDIIAYVSYLETVGPKLMHYCGYILGNWLFPRVVPGYREDPQLTAQYRRTLEEYLAVSIDSIFHASFTGKCTECIEI